MAALGLYMLIADGEWSAEIYSAASDKDQAAMVFNVARDMIKLSPVLRKMWKNGEIIITDSTKHISYTPTMSTYKVIAADAVGNLGANPHAILFDEVLAQPNGDLWDYLRQGFGTRPEPMLIAVTTAGPDRDSFAYKEHEFGIQVIENPDADRKRFAYMAFADAADDPEDPYTLVNCSPALYVPGARPHGFLDPETITAEYDEAKAKGDLVAMNNYRIFHLNQWGNSSTRWLDMPTWDDSEDKAGPYTDADIADLYGIGGLDLAETKDLTSWQIVFPAEDGKLYVKSHFWITKNMVQTRHRKRMAQFLQWQAEGLVTIFESDVQDYAAIQEHILSDIERYKIRSLGYDQFQAPAIINAIEARTDVECVKIPQTTTRMNPGSKMLVNKLGERKLTTNCNPVMRCNAEVCDYKQDNERNVKPDRAKSADAIDGICALVDALCVYALTPEAPEPAFWVFDEEDLDF
jgi:phage terminase large subunit-like protein